MPGRHTNSSTESWSTAGNYVNGLVLLPDCLAVELGKEKMFAAEGFGKLRDEIKTSINR